MSKAEEKRLEKAFWTPEAEATIGVYSRVVCDACGKNFVDGSLWYNEADCFTYCEACYAAGYACVGTYVRITDHDFAHMTPSQFAAYVQQQAEGMIT
jgi:hypothetical protein